MSISYYFSEEDLDEIEKKVRLAEASVSGEIVPVFVERSYHYPESMWIAALFGMIITGMLLLGIDALMGWAELFLISNHIIYLAAMITGGFLLALASVIIPSLKRLLVSDSAKQSQVDAMARQTFLEFELFRTRQRTGILIFVSLFEHRVEILGDKGINEKVSDMDWQHIIDKMIPFLKKHQNKEAMLIAIEESKSLLLKYGFEAGPDDHNELPDHLRQIDKK